MTRVLIDQLMIGAAPGDAVTSMALQLRDALRAYRKSEIYALHIDPALHGDVRSVEALISGSPADLLIYHASFGEPRVTEFLLQTSRRIVVCYHNITPAKFFERDYPQFAESLRWGRTELEMLRPRVVAAFADSQFNADELSEIGYPNVAVMAAGLNPLRLVRHPARALPAEGLLALEGREFVVAVAQQLPHKRLDVVIQAIHLVQSVHRRELGLVIVGADRFPLYGAALRELARRLRVQSLWFANSVPDATLAAIMRSARAFVSASEHEGLGVPPLEAMALDVPVLVRSVAAVPETVGSAGLLLPADAGPEMFAEGIVCLAYDETVRREFISRGARRVRDISETDTTVALVAALQKLAS